MDEIDAMKAIAAALEPLEKEAQGRVLRWAGERYSVAMPKGSGAGKAGNDGRLSPAEEDEPQREFDTAADLLAEAQASSEADRALVIGYWFQVILGQSDIEAQAVNTELKHQGHGLSNVTRAFDSLMHQRPQPVIQVRKTGTSRQARKKYKLTTVGVQRVRRMLSGQAEE